MLPLVGAIAIALFEMRGPPLPPDCGYLSLHLAFCLASGGMCWGSSFLLQKDYKVHTRIVAEILKPEYDCLFGLACTDVRNSDVWEQLTKLYDDISRYFHPIRN